MNIIHNNEFFEFVHSAYKNLEKYKESGRYFHLLSVTDNKPTVVHYSTHQCTVVLSGTGSVTANSKEYNIKTEDILLIPPKTTHSFAAGKEGLLLFHIHIPDEGRENDREILFGNDYNRYE